MSEDVEHNEGKEQIEGVEGHFVFRDIHFRYHDGEKDTLRGLNLEVQAGETIALVGESGAGKSTILNLVNGFYLADSGQVLLDDHDLSRIDLRSYRKYLAVVPQTSILFSGTIRENIIYGCEDVTQEKLDRVIDAANLRELVDSCQGAGYHGG